MMNLDKWTGAIYAITFALLYMVVFLLFPPIYLSLPTMYTKIRLTLEKLVKDGKVKKQRVGKAQVYWWVGGR